MVKSTKNTQLRRSPGRPREFDMEAALDGALLVFREHGYHGASLGELGSAMGLTAGSIYKAFNDKRTLFLAAFDHYTHRRHAELGKLLDAEKTGFDKVRAMLRFYAEVSHDLEGRRGCLVVGSLTHLTTFDAKTSARVTTALRRLETLLRDLIRLGVSDGSIPPGINADALARTLLCLLQGFRVVGKAGRTRTEMLAAVDQALRLLA
ncbi:MAG TPA: TetR/AcrR family transcriptional regulator [Steroidobacter sp.]|uniref:TetR/AcrR family transcriptional regulator n=1 Tax=Steroidobacter sp. TaxID=1978227 RepID=UPI002EDB2F43